MVRQGPFSGHPGRPHFLWPDLAGDVVNVSVTPFTYDELFDNDATAVLSKDRVRIKFAVHIIFKVKSDSEQIQQFVNKYTTLTGSGKEDPNATVKTAYNNFVKEPLRTAARNEVQKCEALQIADNIVEIGHSIQKQIKAICQETPFEIIQVVVGNIQYPEAVANAVADKMAATQRLEQVKIEAQRRIAEAEGIAKSMEVVQQKLTPLYLQHEAIEAQKSWWAAPTIRRSTSPSVQWASPSCNRWKHRPPRIEPRRLRQRPFTAG